MPSFQVNVPQINSSGIPEGDRAEIWLLNGALTGMDRFVRQFLTDVRLFDYCAVQSMVLEGQSAAFRDWLFVAARDGVMAIWHFRNEMKSANDIANKSCHTAPMLDRAKLKAAHTKFDEYFPDFVGSRHAVAHAGELGRSTASFDRNSFTGSYDSGRVKIDDARNVMMSENLQGRTLMSTMDGKVVRCDITGETFERLVEVTQLFYSAFPAPRKADGSPDAPG
jgi:hypothetical protein